MKTPLKQSEKVFLLALANHYGTISAYTLYKKYHFFPFELSKITRKYETLGFVVIEGLNIKLTDTGKKWLVKERENLRLTAENKWRECPERFKQVRLEATQYYIPSIPQKKSVV